jgi:predicted dehydrogenase
VLVTHNARHYAETRKMKALLLEKAIGEVVSVDYHEYLDADHGASYFRRWHRLTANSGSLFVTKACHHFDQINWLLDALPVEVSARGELRVYGRNGAFRSSHCRACPHTARCPYYWDITRDRTAMALYADCEQVDGYLRDGCVFRPDTDIHDSLCATVTYDNGVLATYSANAFLPYEGQAMAFNGNLGRLEWQHYAGGGQRRSELLRKSPQAAGGARWRRPGFDGHAVSRGGDARSPGVAGRPEAGRQGRPGGDRLSAQHRPGGATGTAGGAGADIVSGRGWPFQRWSACRNAPASWARL